MRKLAGFFLLLLPLTIAGCAPDRIPGLRSLYDMPGISLAPGKADPDLQDLVRRVRAEDKHAQLELGKIYEEGRRVPQNLKLAEQLYGQASMTSRKLVGNYAPSFGPPAPSLKGGPKMRGLPEAKLRYEALRARWKQNRGK